MYDCFPDLKLIGKSCIGLPSKHALDRQRLNAASQSRLHLWAFLQDYIQAADGNLLLCIIKIR